MRCCRGGVSLFDFQVVGENRERNWRKKTWLSGSLRKLLRKHGSGNVLYMSGRGGVWKCQNCRTQGPGGVHYVKNHLRRAQVMKLYSWGVKTVKQKRQPRFAKAVPETLLVACISRVLFVHSGWKGKKSAGRVYFVPCQIICVDCNSCREFLEAGDSQWAS